MRLLVMVLVFGSSFAARADSPYRVTEADGVVLGGLALTLGGLALARHQRTFDATCARGDCSEQHLMSLDRYAVGKDSAAWRTISDVGEVGGVVIPFALSALDNGLGGDSWRSFRSDAVVIAEAMLVGGIFNNASKLAIPTPRPRQYRADTYKAVAQSEQSFVCGHCVAATSGATAYATTFWYRHPDSPWRVAVVGGAAAFAGLASWGRVEAGQHFPSDVVAGVGLGVLSGFLVPYLHLKSDLALTLAPESIGVAGTL